MKKRIISTALAFLTCAASAAALTSSAARIQGDVNGDGEFSIADVITLHSWLLGRDNTVLTDTECADLCKDGVINVYDLALMRKEVTVRPFLPPIEEPENICYNDYDEYAAFVEEHGLSGKMITYDDVKYIGGFESFTLASYDPNYYAYIHYVFNDGSDSRVYLFVMDLEKMQPSQKEYTVLKDNDVDPNDMRSTRTYGATGKYTADSKEYIYANGKLSSIKWYDETHEYTLTGSSTLADYPLNADTYTASLLDLRGNGNIAPSPVAVPAQPVHFSDTQALLAEIADCDLSKYDTPFTEIYRQMFENMKGSKFYAVKESYKVTVQENAGVYALPYAKYEDIGVSNYYEYDGKKFQVMFYYTDPAVPADTSSIVDYYNARFDCKVQNTANYNDMKLLLGKYNEKPSVYCMIDDSHYFCARLMTDGTYNDIYNLLGAMEIEELPVK